jgi:hypothetical protein
MEALFHLRDFGYEQLTELTLDGLLIRLTESTWVRKGAILSPAERMAALHSLIPPGLALSHDSAWWVHRGLGRAPAPLNFITLPRRRWIADDGFDVHETTLADDDWCLIDGLPITTEERTLYDLLFPTLPVPDRRVVAGPAGNHRGDPHRSAPSSQGLPHRGGPSPFRRPDACGPGPGGSAAGDAVDVEDAFDLAHGGEHRVQVAGVAHLEDELRLRHPSP